MRGRSAATLRVRRAGGVRPPPVGDAEVRAVAAGWARAVAGALLALAWVAVEPAGLVPTSSPARAVAQELPDGVTAQLVEEGRRLFHGAGACTTCHGEDGRGVPNLGSDLTDREWLHGDGSYGFLLERIRCGVPAEISEAGVPMPPRGGVRLTPEQLRALAAYVWTLSHRDGG